MIRMASRDLRLLLSVILTSTKPMTSSRSSSPPMALITIRTGSSRTSLDGERTVKEAVLEDLEGLGASGLRCLTMMISSREMASALPHSAPAVSEAAWVEPQNP